MRSFIIPAAVAALLAASPVALASESATGAIKAFDMKAMTLTLADGTSYTLPSGFKDPGFKVGEKVQVVWDMNYGKHAATTVTIDK